VAQKENEVTTVNLSWKSQNGT